MGVTGLGGGGGGVTSMFAHRQSSTSVLVLFENNVSRPVHLFRLLALTSGRGRVGQCVCVGSWGVGGGGEVRKREAV